MSIPILIPIDYKNRLTAVNFIDSNEKVKILNGLIGTTYKKYFTYINMRRQIGNAREHEEIIEFTEIKRLVNNLDVILDDGHGNDQWVVIDNITGIYVPAPAGGRRMRKSKKPHKRRKYKKQSKRRTYKK